MKVAVPVHGFAGWTGGQDYLRLVVDSLVSVAHERELQLYVLNPVGGPLFFTKFLGRLIKRAARLQLMDFRSEARSQRKYVDEELAALGTQVHHVTVDLGQHALRKALRRLKADVVIPSMRPLGANSGIPWVGYVYDFQHKHFPQFFTDAERAWRDARFSRMLTECRAVIVNARAVAEDVSTFYPDLRTRVLALPFAPAPLLEWFEQRPHVLPQYGIRSPYFLISNQFWLHKDHSTAFNAFRRIAEERPDVLLVCTGNTHDYRAPEYFGSLKDQLEQSGIVDRVHILGLLPKLDQIELMKGATAVLQPTLFEGGPGGGAVYDAIAVGTRSIVSNIPVNMEIGADATTVKFFRAGDAGDLAEKMRQTLGESYTRPSQQALVEQGRQRRIACGRVLLHAIDEA